MTSNQTSEELKTVTIYTDGACTNNPGPGGYGVVMLFGKNRKELSGGFALTTNNRVEIMAVIVGLEALKFPCEVLLHTDSRYVVDTMTLGWAKRWKANNWYRTANERAVNYDLWERLLPLCEKHSVEFIWVKGHAGVAENERCDQLAVAAAAQKDLPPDNGYIPKSAEKAAPKNQMQLEFDKAEVPIEKAQPEPKFNRDTNRHIKITYEGQPCRKCGTPVVKRTPKKREHKSNQSYYYEYYLHCPTCQTMYMVDDARVML